MTDGSGRAAAAAREFRFRFEREPDGVWVAPGRVNLIGEHTDYNDGFVLPIAIDRTTLAVVGARADGRVRGWSAQLGTAAEVDVDHLRGEPARSWIAYVAGVAWALREKGLPVSGLDVLIDSQVPVGAGLSSSAALSCSVALALAEIAGGDVERLDLATAAQRAEREVVGAPVGIMDQAVSLLGRAGHALFLDCRTLRLEHVPLPFADERLRLLVIDTGVAHANAGGGYADRRRECAEAAAALGVPALRDAGVRQLDSPSLSPLLRRRSRHVVTENLRVQAAVEALRAGRMDDLGALLTESHASLRDDFEVSVPELDCAVETATAAGALGARMTGGGFGGSALALAPADAATEIARRVRTGFAERGFCDPAVFAVRASSGARRTLEA